MIILFCSIVVSIRNYICKVGCMIFWNIWCSCRIEVYCGYCKCYKIDEFILFSVYKKLKEYKNDIVIDLCLYILKIIICLFY